MAERIPLPPKPMEEDMSLIDALKEPCTMIEKKRSPDGEGGFATTWPDGAEFCAAITFNSSAESRCAEKDCETSLYTVTTSKDVLLKYRDVFRRNRDGKVFRVTLDGDDVQTPKCAGFQFVQVTAEEWTLPVDGGVT